MLSLALVGRNLAPLILTSFYWPFYDKVSERWHYLTIDTFYLPH